MTVYNYAEDGSREILPLEIEAIVPEEETAPKGRKSSDTPAAAEGDKTKSN